jgi:hypothetical protein
MLRGSPVTLTPKCNIHGLNPKLVITNYYQFEPKTLHANKRSLFDVKIGEDGKRQEAR